MQTASARDSWNARYSASTYEPDVAPNQFVERYLADLDSGEAIDLGAGKGRNAVWLASRGWRVTAVDFSSDGLASAARLAADRDVAVDVVEADATTFQPDGLFDLVVLSYLQLDPKGRRAVLEHAKGWLKVEGTIFVIAHDRTNIADGHAGPSMPEVCYTVDEVVDALDGLVIETATVVERAVATDEGERTALDTLVVAKRRGS